MPSAVVQEILGVAVGCGLSKSAGRYIDKRNMFGRIRHESVKAVKGQNVFLVKITEEYDMPYIR